MSQKSYDFEGWVTKNDLRCSDGRTIRKNAFKDQDGGRVPLCWGHQHDDPTNVLGHMDLENREEGVWGYGSFNKTELAQYAKEQVIHGDITCLSIWANHLTQTPEKDVIHGIIREVSLVLAGANPGASIQRVLAHGDYDNDSMVIYSGEQIICHSDSDSDEEEKEEKEKKEDTKEEISETKPEELEHADDKKEENKMAEAEKKDKTVQDVIDTMNDEQKNVLYALVGEARAESENNNSKEEKEDMKHSVFDTESKETTEVLSHDDMTQIMSDAKRLGSLKEAFLQHGITEIETLFPDPKELNNTPKFIDKDYTWVQSVMNSVHRSPISRIKTRFADITQDEARAKGYLKGNRKKEEVFSLLKRSTSPTTVYKKQSFDRDDIVDITDFDVVNWVRGEMDMKLDQELARAYLLGDQRLASDDDKIDESCIRPVWKDDDLFTIKQRLTVPSTADADTKAKAYIKAIIRARKNYRGSGRPTFYTTEDVLTDMLLLTDTTGRDLYDSVEKLATKLRVKEIVTVPVMENVSHEVSGKTYNLIGIVVNMADYSVGADKGGAKSMFEDFDIDYNRMKYLIETRRSGALTEPFSCISIEETVSAEASTITSTLSTMEDGLAPYRPVTTTE